MATSFVILVVSGGGKKLNEKQFKSLDYFVMKYLFKK